MSESRKLLVIDEDTYLLRTFVQLAQSAGYRVEGSPDARNGWDLARKLRPDVILLNTRPPQGTGTTFCRKAKADPVLAQAAIMLLADGMQGDTTQPDLPGIDVDEYILKPITSRDLLARVQALLRVKRSETQLAHIRQELQHKQSLLATAQQQLRAAQQPTRKARSAAQKPAAPQDAPRLGDLYETLPIGCCTVDQYGMIFEANTLAARLCAGVRQSSAFVETLFPDYVADDDVGVFFQNLSQAFHTKQRQRCDVRLKNRGAQPRAVRLEMQVQPAEHTGEQGRCTLTCTDISAYLATSQRQQQRIAQLEQQAKLRQRNERQQAKARPQKQQDLNAEQKQIEALLKTQERLQATLESHYVSPETFERHVKELRQAQERVQQELAGERCRLRAVLDSVNDGVALCDITGRFEIFNARMQEITGYSPAEANAHIDFQLVLYPDPARYQHAIQRMTAIASSGEAQSCITTIRAKDGAEKTLAVYTARVQCGNQGWLLSTYQDITEYRHLKQRLIRSQKQRRKPLRA